MTEQCADCLARVRETYFPQASDFAACCAAAAPDASAERVLYFAAGFAAALAAWFVHASLARTAFGAALYRAVAQASAPRHRDRAADVDDDYAAFVARHDCAGKPAPRSDDALPAARLIARGVAFDEAVARAAVHGLGLHAPLEDEARERA